VAEIVLSEGNAACRLLTFYAEHSHTAEVVEYCFQLKKRGVLIYAYANNHFAGYAPATIEQF
jgi:hypothetical protein